MASGIEAPPAAAVAEARAYLRIEGGEEEGLLAMLVATGMALCERFTGLALIEAPRRVAMAVAPGAWRRLPVAPVRAITAVAAIDAAGIEQALAPADHAVDIDAAGEGWVRVTAPVAGRIAVDFVAGMAPDWAGLPAPLRQGVVRLAAHLHAHRDEADDAGPPAAVAALWRPWRRVRLA